MKGYIYLIENKINSKKYIGQTSYSIERRMAEHIRGAKQHPNRPLYRAINKYGEENFNISIVEECEINLLSEREIYWINKFNTYYGDGYNATLGGEGTTSLNKEEIIVKYLQYQNVTTVATLLRIDAGSVRKILRENDIEILSSDNVLREKCGNKVSAYDFKTGVLIYSFSSQAQAAQWILEQKKTKLTNIRNIGYIIGRAAKGEDNRKQAYGFIWKYVL